MSGANGNSPSSGKNLMEIEDLWKTYQMGAEEIHALRGVTFEIERGSYVAIMGPSGSGKSTLMNLIGCLDTPSKGTYLLNARMVSKMDDDELARIRNKEIGFVFQTFNLLPRASADLQRNAGFGKKDARHRSPAGCRTGRTAVSPAERALRRPAPESCHRPRAGQQSLTDSRR